MSMIFCFESLETTTKEKLLSKQAQDLLDSKSDMDLVKNKPELITASLKELASKYNHDNFKAAARGDVFHLDAIRKVSRHSVACNFRLRANTPEEVGDDEIYGVRKRDQRKNLFTTKHPFLIRAPRRNNYLVAVTSGSYNGGFFGHFFYARQSRASKFMFGKVGAREKKGFVKHNIEVELACCNDAGEPIAVVQRFEGDQTTSGTEQIRNTGFIEFQ
ncbi:hypothetical protein BDV40DRAFT_294446 [Aspergillus tamarii]|uniref:Uncharacterized protein n=1 Tax=Aspergillus tamarii TaxID=41984 RepID=A0A5N6VCB3_ASPTM|nr:hypothetical protein BDV40DRAFT_294446 [Aspergillus tamarii]